MNRSLAALALLSLVVSGCTEQGESAEASSVLTAPAQLGDLSITAEATGSIEPIRTVEVKSKASGEILRLYVDVGDRVDAGDLLAEVDPRDVRNGYNQAQADLQVAEARMGIAEAQLNRANELIEAGVITAEEHEAKNLEYANAQAALTRATTNLELAELRLSDVTIRAPSAGTILTKSVEVGGVIQSASGNVSGGTVLMLMADLNEMQVRTLVDETDMGEIRAGMPANVDVEAFPNRAFTGDVLKIEPQAVVEQNITMFPVIVTLENRDGLLRPGMNAEVTVLIAEERNTLTIPNNTVVQVQQVAPAAMVLGLDPNEVNMDRSVFADLQRQAMGITPANDADADPEGLGGPTGGTASRADVAEIRAKIQSGEISRDSARVLFQAAGIQPGQTRPGARAEAGGENGGFAGDAFARPGGDAQGAARFRPAYVFVVRADGSIEGRPVLTGLSDWDRTQIVAGLAEGEQVAQIGAAQLQASQQEFLDRVRSRRGGPF